MHACISFGETEDEFVEVVTLPLTTSYGGIKKLTVDAHGRVHPDLKKLIAVTDHQSQLQPSPYHSNRSLTPLVKI